MVCTLLRLDTGLPFVAVATLVANPDGSVSFQLPNNAGWAGQEPNAYGVRHPDQPAGETPGAYQRFTLAGQQVVSLTRPQDQPMVYLLGQGQAY